MEFAVPALAMVAAPISKAVFHLAVLAAQIIFVILVTTAVELTAHP
jgi:hypothetical protein